MFKQFFLLIANVLVCLSASIIICAQTEQRTVKFTGLKNEPIAIEKLELSGKETSFNQPFNYPGEDWFRDLTVTVKNVSDQEIHFLTLRLAFPSGKTDRIPSIEHLVYGCGEPSPDDLSRAFTCPETPLYPNQTARLVLKDYERTRLFLTETGQPPIIREFELAIGEVVFANGKMWITGQTMRQDPNDEHHWLPDQTEQ